MKKFDPYEFLNENLEHRPFDKDKNRDGNVRYIHQCENNNQVHSSFFKENRNAQPNATKS